MNMKILCCVVLGVVVLALGGCDLGYADDAIKQQELGRLNRRIPEATELPPGLGEDLPETAATVESPAAGTQPISTNQ